MIFKNTKYGVIIDVPDWFSDESELQLIRVVVKETKRRDKELKEEYDESQTT